MFTIKEKKSLEDVAAKASSPDPEHLPEPSCAGGIPPSTPPKNRGGLSGWQKAVIGASVPIVILAGYFGINALRNQQYKPVGTPTPVATATLVPTATPIPTPTSIPGIENVLNEAQIKATLEDILSLGRPLTNDDSAVWKKKEDVNKSSYFALFRRTFEQEKFVTRIVRSDEQVPNVSAISRNPDGTLKDVIAGTIAYAPNGVIEIYVAGLPVSKSATDSLYVALVLANETFNAKDAKLFLTDPRFRAVEHPDATYEGLVQREASKSLGAAAVLQYWKDLGVKGLSIADTPTNRKLIRSAVEGGFLAETVKMDGNGWLLGLQYVYNDLEARQEFEQSGELTTKTALRLHDVVLNDMLNPQYKQSVKDFLSSKETLTSLKEFIIQSFYKRLVPDGAINDVATGYVHLLFVP